MGAQAPPSRRAVGPKTLISFGKIWFSKHWQRPRIHAGKDNLAPAEDLHNKNPSLVALGEKSTYGA